MTNDTLVAAQMPYLFEFICFEADGTNPLDLTGGDVQLLIQRNGLKPFEIVKRAVDATWDDVATGAGSFVVDLTSAPLGHSRYQLLAAPVGFLPSVQAQGWLRITHVWTPVISASKRKKELVLS